MDTGDCTPFGPVESIGLEVHMTARVVGIALDDRVLRGVELRRRRRPGHREAEVVRVGAIALPAGVVDQGEIADSAAFSDHLGKLWSESGFSTKHVAVGLDARATVVRRADLPALAPAELRQAAAFEIGDLLSYPLPEALISVQELGRTPTPSGESIQALTLAVKQQTLVDIHAAIGDAGLRKTELGLTQSALVTAINAGDDLPDQSVGLIVGVSQSTTNVMLHDNAGLLLSRVITAGVGSESSLADELQVELDRLAGSGAAPVAGTATNSSGVATVMEGIRRTAHYFRSEIDDRQITRIVLCGEQSNAGGLAEALADSFPEADVLRHERAQWPVEGRSNSDYDDAFAVAFAATGPSSERRFDLVPTVHRERRARALRVAAGVSAALALAPFLYADAIDRRGEADAEIEIVQGAERRVSDLRLELESFDDHRETEILARLQSDRVEVLLEDRYPMSSVIRQLAEAMPADTFIVSARVQRTAPGETPTGYAGAQPPAVLTLTGVAADLDGVGRWMEAAATVPLIDGIWLAQSAIGPYDSTERVGAVFTVDAVLIDPTLQDGEPE